MTLSITSQHSLNASVSNHIKKNDSVHMPLQFHCRRIWASSWNPYWSHSFFVSDLNKSCSAHTLCFFPCLSQLLIKVLLCSLQSRSVSSSVGYFHPINAFLNSFCDVGFIVLCFARVLISVGAHMGKPTDLYKVVWHIIV